MINDMIIAVILTIIACYILVGIYVVFTFYIDYLKSRNRNDDNLSLIQNVVCVVMTIALWPYAVWFAFVITPQEFRRELDRVHDLRRPYPYE